MNRRDFLKFTAVESLAVITTQLGRKFSFIFPGAILPGDFVARLGNMLFKGTTDGRLLVSIDGGVSWRCSANFGGDCLVQNLYVRGGRLFVEIGIPGGTFELASADGIRWYTFG